LTTALLVRPGWYKAELAAVSGVNCTPEWQIIPTRRHGEGWFLQRQICYKPLCNLRVGPVATPLQE